MNRLKELRNNAVHNGHKMRQADLAELLEVTKLTILNWENGKHKIKADKANELAKLFNVSVAYLLGYDDSDLKNETNIKVAVLDKTLKKLHVIKDNMILRESDEGPNLFDLGLVIAIAAIEIYKKEIEGIGGE